MRDPKNVVMAALYHIDRVDLHVAEMLHRFGHRLGSIPERRRAIQSLSPKPDVSSIGLREREGGWVV